MVDGGCPESKNAEPCPDKPLAARVTVVNSDGEPVGETTSNDGGNFRLELPPGNYELHPANLTGAPLPEASPEYVTVRAGNFIEAGLSKAILQCGDCSVAAPVP
jgi:hypothetical protein